MSGTVDQCVKWRKPTHGPGAIDDPSLRSVAELSMFPDRSCLIEQTTLVEEDIVGRTLSASLAVAALALASCGGDDGGAGPAHRPRSRPKRASSTPRPRSTSTA